MHNCPDCKGDGWVYESRSDPEAKRVRCETCDGDGVIDEEEDEECES